MEMSGVLSKGLIFMLDKKLNDNSNGLNQFQTYLDNLNYSSSNLNKKDFYNNSNKNKFNVDSSKNKKEDKSNNFQINKANNEYSKDLEKLESIDSISYEETQEPEKVKNLIILFDKDILNFFSQLMGLTPENIVKTLSDMKMPLSSLENLDNVIEFLKSSYNMNDSLELISKDNIKEIISGIMETAKQIQDKDFINLDSLENFNEIFNELNGEIKEVIKHYKGPIDFNKANIVFKENVQKPNLSTQSDENIINISEVSKDLVNINNKQDINKNNLTKNNLTKNNLTISQINNETKVFDINMKNQDIIDLENTINAEETKILDTLTPNKINMYENKNSFVYTNLNKNSNFDLENLFDNSEFNNITDIAANFNINNDNKILSQEFIKTQILSNIDSIEVINQILDKMKTSVKQDMTEVKILLRPEHLGEVSLRIISQNGAVTAQFTAESQRVKEIIESNFNMLKDMLKEQGLDVFSLDVDVSSGQSEENFNQHIFENRKPSKKLNYTVENAEEVGQNIEKLSNSDDLIESNINYSV